VELKVVSFDLGHEQFAVDIMKIDSVVETGKIVKIPESAEYVEGVMNLRGTLIPVINLRKKFKMEDFPEKDKCKIIVTNLEAGKVGFLVDNVKEVLTISQDDIEETPRGVGGIGGRYILGMAKHGDNILIILNIDEILTAEEKIEIEKIMEKT